MSFLSFKNSCFSFTAASFKSGKINNITAMSSGLFACEKITFEEPFSGGKQVKVFVSPGNSTNGAAVWVESEDQRQFRPCISEYIDGSNTSPPPRPRRGGGGGAYIRRGDVTEGFLGFDFGGLIFGGTYLWNFTVPRQ